MFLGHIFSDGEGAAMLCIRPEEILIPESRTDRKTIGNVDGLPGHRFPTTIDTAAGGASVFSVPDGQPALFGSSHRIRHSLGSRFAERQLREARQRL
jgi:hypothetical protein